MFNNLVFASEDTLIRIVAIFSYIIQGSVKAPMDDFSQTCTTITLKHW